MPENWRAALLQLARMTPESWEDAYGDLARQKRGQPVHAITGATISSQALTDGVRSTVGHFRKRWELLAPHLEEPS
jgi:Na+-translocating ferredoxin:NAD+ oxidoreductase RnfG subunit